MNVISRGIRNAFRSPLRSGAIILMLAVSMALILAMLVANASVANKINQLKAGNATQITITPAGIRGGFGGGDPLTADQVKTIDSTAHVVNVASTLTDQLGETDTNLTPSLTLGSFGMRQQRFESSSDTPGQTRRMPTPRTTVTGASDVSSVIATNKITSGSTFEGTGSDNVALVGKTLADKNNLASGSTFTTYGQTITVKGIYNTGNTFQDNGLVMPLTTLQTLTNQAGAVTSAVATADSSDNVAGVVSALQSSLAGKADIVSQQDQIDNSLAPLKSIAGLALGGVIAAAAAGAVIVLLAMIMIVRERRREIGVMKAIGGSNVKVIAQFITEALTLTVISAVIGLGIGVAVSGPLTQSLVASSSQSSTQTQTTPGSEGRGTRGGGFAFRQATTQLNTNVRSVTSVLTPQIFASSLGVIFLIAIIGSAVPAWAIARVRPAEVLRTE